LSTLLIAADAFGSAPPEVQEALSQAGKKAAAEFRETKTITVAREGLDAWFEVFRTMQAFEVWRSVGSGVESLKPKLRPGVGERLKWVATVTPVMYQKAVKRRAEIVRRLKDLLPPGTALCVPSSPRVVPLRSMPVGKIEVEFRNQSYALFMHRRSWWLAADQPASCDAGRPAARAFHCVLAGR
jgi:amidase